MRHTYCFLGSEYKKFSFTCREFSYRRTMITSISGFAVTVLLLAFFGFTCGQNVDGNLKVLARAFDKCGRSTDLGTCLKIKTVHLLDKALMSQTPIQINDFVTLKTDPDAIENASIISEAEVESQLSKNPEEKDETLNDMIVNRMARYIQSKSIQITLPSDLSESRKKKDKGGMMMMAAIAMGGMMVQMAMGKIGMIAGKALIVGKMALLLSAVIALKKLMGGGDSGGSSHPQVVYATESHGSGGGGGGWGRSIEVNTSGEAEDAHELAYRGRLHPKITPMARVH